MSQLFIQTIFTRKLKIALISADYSAETALAIATHQLIFAPPPSHHDYDDRSSKKPTTDYKYTGFTDKYTETPYDEFSSTPIYKTTTNQEYDPTYTTILNRPRTSSSTTIRNRPRTSPSTTIRNPPRTSSSTTIRNPPQTSLSSTIRNRPRTSSSTTFTAPLSTTYASLNDQKPSTFDSTFSDYQTSTYSSPFKAKVSRPAGFTPPEIITLSQGPSTLNSYLSSPTLEPRFSSSFPVPANLPSTSRYLPNQKLIPVPVEDYSYSTGGYSDVKEPAYFTREYLLESPVTKTYDGKLI